jgi:hypothetical protein
MGSPLFCTVGFFPNPEMGLILYWIS